MKIKIKSVFGAVLFEYEKENNTIRETLIEAVSKRADLRGADLRGADLDENFEKSLQYAQTRILPEGDIIGYKQCSNGILVKLKIPADAKRTHAFGRKCRAEYAEVLEIHGAATAHSSHDPNFIYTVGATVKPQHPFSDNWKEECESGIHFFITKIEAENY